MHDIVWPESEKRVARRVFDAALKHELGEIMAEFKARADRAKTPEEMWSVAEYLAQKRHAIDQKYDYRYSRLLDVFGVLLSEKRIEERELVGLGDAKLAIVRRTAGFLYEARSAR